MSRGAAAIVLFALGLAIGLYLGFNPQAHAATQQAWTTAQHSVAQVSSGGTVRVGIPVTGNAQQQPSGESRSSGTEVGARVTAVLQDLWAAARQIWFSLTAKLKA